MRKRLWSLTAAALTVLASVGAINGCSHRNGDVNRVVDPYWNKADFDGEHVWYYRSTVVDTAPGSSFINGTVGDGDWLLLERLRWEVTETYLMGYRDYESAPGTEHNEWEGGSDVYKGAPVAMFAIKDHFDIRRNYDSITGEETNVIVENRERAWYDRNYMRVDWSANRVPTFRFHTRLEQVADSYVVQANDPGDPKRFRFESDDAGRLNYIEVTTRSQYFPDIASLLGYNGPGYVYDTPAMMLDLRHSFVRASQTEINDFEILHMPESVVLENGDGTEVRDDNGIAVRVPIADRFGLYSTFGRNVWDPSRGIGDWRQNHATIFNLWEQTKNADGSLIPVHRRTPKPVVYYTNVTHPKHLMSASIDRVGGDWNEAFKEAVFLAQTVDVPAAERPFTSIDQVPDMFVVLENTCNPSNVKTVLEGLPPFIQTNVMLDARQGEVQQNGRVSFDGTIKSVVDRYEWANAADNDAPFDFRQAMETRALEDLERICTALEYHTNPEVSGDDEMEQFKYQRFGDVRYNMLNLIMQDHNNQWLGYGPMLGDPVTGRTVQATAHIAMVLLDRAATRYSEMIDAMNGLIPQGDLISGLDVEAYMASKMAAARDLKDFQPGEELRNSMRRRITGLGTAQDALQEISPSYVEDRLSRLAGTQIEHKLISPDDALVFGGIDPAVVATGTVTLDEALMNQVSPVRSGHQGKKLLARDEVVQKLGERTMDTIEFIDRFGWSIALRLKDEPDRRKRFEKIREELYVSVQLHEVGHNVGLVHNFEASSDALNYGERFWRLQAYPQNPLDALASGAGLTEEERALVDACLTEQQALNARLAANRYSEQVSFTTQECLGQQETMYSSIMDYHGTWNGDFSGLGRYDQAAIKFAYARVLETFPESTITATSDIKEWTYYNDWRDIPTEVVNSTAAINDRDHVKYDWSATSTRQAPPSNVVPYRYCYGAYYTPWCTTRDFGPDMRTGASLLETRYYQYYFFSHFNRGRLWDWSAAGPWLNAFASDEAVMLDYTRKMQWYVFQSVNDPKFAGTYAEQDFMASTVKGINHIMHVLGQPASGFHVSQRAYQVESLIQMDTDDDRLAPTDVMRRWDWQGSCTASSLVNTASNGGRPISAKPGFNLTWVPLGDGRPFFLGLTDDYEDWYVRYIGSFYAKSDALFYLGYNRAFFPRVNSIVDPRTFDISWYRLFPDEVGSIISSIVGERDHELGYVVDPDGAYVMRDLIDPVTGKTPDYTGYTKVAPTIAFNHRYLAMVYATALMSSAFDDEADFLKSLKVAVEGAYDDFGSFDYVRDEAIANGEDPDDYVAEFVHPHVGHRIRAMKSGKNPVAYEAVKRANLYKERYERLQACAQDPDGLAQTDTYCHCVMVSEPRADGFRYCVAEPYLQPAGQGDCAVYELERRADRAREDLDSVVDFIDDIRAFNSAYGEW
jgi:hypothetical protein